MTIFGDLLPDLEETIVWAVGYGMGPLQGAPSLPLRLQPNPDTTRAQVLAAARGDTDARAWVVSEFGPRVYRTCLAILKDETDARDATQETLLKALRKLDTVREDGRFDAWLLQIARNTCYNEFRRRRTHARPVDDDILAARPDPRPSLTPGEQIDRQRLGSLVRLALAQLPESYREVLELYHFQHLKYREIADVLELPIGTVMNRIFRARKKMRLALEALGATEDFQLAPGAEKTA